MSHVVTIASPEAFNNLDAVAEAAAACGGTLVRDQKGFTGWGGSRHPCAHAITFEDSRFQIGLRASEKVPGGYELAYDPYDGSIDRHVSGPRENRYAPDRSNLERFAQAYQVAVAKQQFTARGMTFTEETIGDEVVLTGHAPVTY